MYMHYLTAPKLTPPNLANPFLGVWIFCSINCFKNWPDNGELPLHKLARKMGSLIMLSTMCRGQELAMLRLSCMTKVSPHEIVFHLPITTKTYNIKTIHNKEMQQLKIAAFPQVSKLCPMTVVLDYIQQSKTVRKGEDSLFVLPGCPKLGPASKMSITRWVKDTMSDAGLKNFQVHTTRSLAATNALLLGLPIDSIVAKAGWKSATMFVKHYMKQLSHLHLLAYNPAKRQAIIIEQESGNTPHTMKGTPAPSPVSAHSSEDLKSAFATLWTKDYKIKPQKIKNPSKVKYTKFHNKQLAKKKMHSAKKMSSNNANPPKKTQKTWSGLGKKTKMKTVRQTEDPAPPATPQRVPTSTVSKAPTSPHLQLATEESDVRAGNSSQQL